MLLFAIPIQMSPKEIYMQEANECNSHGIEISNRV